MVNAIWWPQNVNAGEVIYPPGGTYGPRTQTQYQLVALHTGRLELSLDGTTYRYRAGQVFLLRPGHREYFAFAEDVATRHSWVAGTVRDAPERAHSAVGDAPPCTELSSTLDHLLQLSRDAVRHTGPYGPHLARSAAQAALLCFFCEVGLGYNGAAHPQRDVVQRAQDYAREHLFEPITLPDLAHAASVSPEHLCRLFQAECQTTPMAFVWSIRTEEAQHLLAASGLSIKEIADRCGFRSVFHFSRRIKAASGLSPSAYRTAHWNP